jgi:hypothetical protein
MKRKINSSGCDIVFKVNENGGSGCMEGGYNGKVRVRERGVRGGKGVR